MVKTMVLFLATIIFSVSIVIGCPLISLAQRTSSVPQSKPASSPSLMAALPQSDAVGLVKIQPLLNDALPMMVAQNPAKLGEVNAEIEKLKARIGLDARMFDQIAFGMRYSYPRAGVTKVDTVAVGRGTFKVDSFVEAGKAAPAGKYREEKYQGRTLYIFTLDQQLRIFGMFNMKVSDLAVAPLDANTLALGNVSEVKRAIDATKTRADSNAELIALATGDPNALVGFGGKVTPALVESLKLDNEAIAKDVSSIRQVYGSVSTTEKDVAVFIAARATTAASAQELSRTLKDLSNLGAFFVTRMPVPKRTAASTALDNLKITTQGSELQIRTTVAQADIGSLMK